MGRIVETPNISKNVLKKPLINVYIDWTSRWLIGISGFLNELRVLDSKCHDVKQKKFM